MPDETAPPEASLPHDAESPGTGFHVDLGDLFEGPFDLLLGLIAKHKLDVTEVALSKVTDEFIAHIKAMGSEWDLGQATEFLVVAATLLDLKAARLLPSGEVEDEEDLALLEARDLLFARLLQYRAYKQVANVFAGRMAHEAGRYARAVTLEPQFAGLLPEVLLGLGPQEFAALAARALTPKPVPTVGLDHLHAPQVSVREQAAILVTSLRRWGTSTFRQLTADCEGTLVVVARLLALLELYRESAVAFDQVSPLGELTVRWTGTDEGEVGVTDEFDGEPEAAEGADADPTGAADPTGTPAAPDVQENHDDHVR
ncbi:MAG: segregation and condensation protein A [Actinomycetes bacterium]